jgi:hypothetical protein
MLLSFFLIIKCQLLEYVDHDVRRPFEKLHSFVARNSLYDFAGQNFLLRRYVEDQLK